jgi:hypothetical protein
MPVPWRSVPTAKHFARDAAPSQIGLSIRVSGMLYTFGCLVLPALTTVGLLCLALALALPTRTTGLEHGLSDWPPVIRADRAGNEPQA